MKSSSKNPLTKPSPVFSLLAAVCFIAVPLLFSTGWAAVGPLEADLSIIKSGDNNPVNLGDTLTYTITVTNHGPDTADGVTVSDILPPEVTFVSTTGCAEDPAGCPTCFLGSIAAGGSGQYTLVVTVDSFGEGILLNQAFVSSSTYDPNGGNDVVYDQTYVYQPEQEPNEGPQPPQRYRLTVVKAGEGDGTVVSEFPGIDCGDDCMQYYTPGAFVPLTAIADEGSTFVGWSDACTGTTDCTLIMNRNKAVTANFDKLDSDGDGTPDDRDLCPNDPDKIDPGACGCGVTDDDNDQNGIPDCLDADDDNGIPEDLDMDGNGIPDRDQDDMRVTPGGTAGDLFIGVVVPPGISLELLEWIDPSTIDDSSNRPDQLPLGLINFSALMANPGDTVELTFYFSEPIPEGAVWYKYDPAVGWYDFSDYVVISEDRMSLTIMAQDGGPGDADGEANGIFNDPSGPGLFDTDDNGGDDTAPVNPNSSGSGSGGGCFLKAVTAR